jgi:hypothetical protein
LIQVALDVHEYPQNAFAVVVFGLQEHRQAPSVKPSASEDNVSRATFDRLIVFANSEGAQKDVYDLAFHVRLHAVY